MLVLSKLFFPFMDKFCTYSGKQFFLRRDHPVTESTSPMCLDNFQIRVNAFKSLRYKAGETGTDGFHPQLFHPLQYLMLQIDLPTMPILIQRTVNATDIPHPHPG